MDRMVHTRQNCNTSYMVANVASAQYHNFIPPGTARWCKNGSHASLQFHGERGIFFVGGMVHGFLLGGKLHGKRGKIIPGRLAWLLFLHQIPMPGAIRQIPLTKCLIRVRLSVFGTVA